MTGRQSRTSRCLVTVASLGISLLSVSVARAGHAARPRPAVKKAINIPKPTRTIEGKVVEVRRISRDVTVRTRQGTFQHVAVPREAAVRAPHGERGLDGIRRGMAVRIVDGMRSQKVIARTIVAHATTGAEPQARLASHRVAR